MNKYQQFALDRVYYAVYRSENFDDANRTDKTGDGRMSIVGETDTFVIKQDEDYRIAKHYLRIAALTVKKVVFNGKEYNPETISSTSYPQIIVPVDFAQKINEIEVAFNEVLDPIKIPIEYIESDKKAFDQKLKETHRQELLQKAEIKIATGVDLVNIYFSPSSDSYASAKIELYTAIGQFEQHHGSVVHAGWKPKLLGGTAERLIGKFTVEEGMFFKAITGLAKGVYAVKLIQLDSKQNTIFESDFNFFVIG